MPNKSDPASLKARAPLLRRQSWIRWLAKRSTLVYSVHEWRKNWIRRKFVQEVLPLGGIGAELGVHKGYFTRCLLDNSKPRRLHLVDPWYLLGSEWPWTGGNRCTVRGLVGVFLAFRKEIKTGQVEVHVSGDLEVLTGFSDGYLDWAYVDSSHEYMHTLQELEMLKCKVCENGVIAGDDWQIDPNHPHHGVCRAVLEFIDREPYELVYSSALDKQWAIRRIKTVGIR